MAKWSKTTPEQAFIISNEGIPLIGRRGAGEKDLLISKSREAADGPGSGQAVLQGVHHEHRPFGGLPGLPFEELLRHFGVTSGAAEGPPD